MYRNSVTFHRWSYLIAKRSFDIFAACLGLIVLAPVMLGIAALIRLNDGGPAIYRGRRTGRGGRPFEILKFRSMVVDAERRGGSTTGKDDPRITPVGAILRKYKLDELPQLISVLIGDMSIVGPRPEVAEYTDRYNDEERRILSVRPGITDWASLEFNDLQDAVGSDDPDTQFRERVLPIKNSLRLRYVDQQSFLTDLAIVAKTAAVVVSKPFRRSA
jgi:lipopolysaccharide/colanic/teichoic acid biosynthesis glycosyltransferase